MLRLLIGFGTGATSCALVVIVVVATVTAQQSASSAPSCKPAGSLITVADLPEGSGVAVSERIPGRLWALNDSREPMLSHSIRKALLSAASACLGQEWRTGRRWRLDHASVVRVSTSATSGTTK